MTRSFVLFLISAASCCACGIWYPTAYVLRNDDVFYAPPEVGFAAELRYLIPDSVPHEAILDDDLNPVDELQLALAETDNSELERQSIIESYEAFRETLNEAKQYIDCQPFEYYLPRIDSDTRNAALDQLAALTVPNDLPLEFQYYLAGAVSYYQEDWKGARAHWQAVLDLPEAQRRYRSVMAAFMLGKTAEQKAPQYYRLVRALVEEGFSDQQGLAAASYGREAQHYLHRANKVVDSDKPYRVAMELYLKQWASGYYAGHSLKVTADAAWQYTDDRELRSLLKDHSARAVMTAYLLTECWGEQADRYRTRLSNALPSPKDLKVEEAGRFALVEYQQNNLAATRLWLEYAAPDDALALWVRSKVLLREGQIDEGRALMVTLTEELSQQDSDWRRVDTSRAWGELGLLMLQKERFVDAADCFMNSGSWEDCAYLLERILLTDELIAWVRAQPVAEEDNHNHSRAYKVHALAARRLMREGHFEEALEFFDLDTRSNVGAYLEAMRAASAPEAEPAERAQHYWKAARMLRDNGMSMVATELAPDFAWHGGRFNWSDTFEEREANEGVSDYRINRMAWQETKRGGATAARPNKRYHYRYRAAQLAELAAGLLPNNDENAARIYRVAGEWLRLRDPEAADRLYKQLVVRCPETELGQAAAQLNWFPEVDLQTIEPFSKL